jgi:uracil-DNA glycosylase
MSTNEWEELLESDWGPRLGPDFGEPYWSALWSFILGDPRDRVYPPEGDVFRALLLTKWADTKIVILGQDPYHGPGQAHGLCFSVPCGVKVPPSLKNIHRELQKDWGAQPPNHGSLESWASRGVLLLNTTLTVSAGAAGSHRRYGWKSFTDRIVEAVAEKPGVVFMLWGKEAQRKRRIISRHGRKIISSSHPSPQAAKRCPRPFLGSRPFSRANKALASAQLAEIDWTLPDCP